MSGLRVLVCGSRTIDRPELVFQELNRVRQEQGVAEVITGGARGPDQEAAGWTRARPEIKLTVITPDWEKHKRRAGIIRNLALLDLQPDLVLAFWDGKSHGTWHTISEARKRQIPVAVMAVLP